MMDGKEKSKALEVAIASVEKEFGKGAIMRLKDGETISGDVTVIPTGSLGLDVALGIGGYPRGRIVEIFGPESSGKTTLTLHAIANVVEPLPPPPTTAASSAHVAAGTAAPAAALASPTEAVVPAPSPALAPTTYAKFLPHPPKPTV